MLRDEYKLLVEESERKPNQYVAKILLFCIPIDVLCWILNECGLFRVDHALMRTASVAGLLACLIPSVLIKNKKLAINPMSKYLIMIFAIVDTLIYTITLNFHVTLMFIFPMLLATQYRSKKICWVAVSGSVLCTVLAPIMGYLLGVWDPDFFTMLLEISSGSRIDATMPIAVSHQQNIISILVYIVGPKLLCIIAFSVIIFAVNEHGISDLESRMRIIHLNETDVLTEALNRNMYEVRLSAYENSFDEVLTCIFADADGLHELNNSKGHAAGDALLQCVSKAIREEFDKEDVYRVGGDEFIAFGIDLDAKTVEEKLVRIRQMIESKDYHASVGFAQMRRGESLTTLIESAEVAMYQEKKHFYETHVELDRRRCRN